MLSIDKKKITGFYFRVTSYVCVPLPAVMSLVIQCTLADTCWAAFTYRCRGRAGRHGHMLLWWQEVVFSALPPLMGYRVQGGNVSGLPAVSRHTWYHTAAAQNHLFCSCETCFSRLICSVTSFIRWDIVQMVRKDFVRVVNYKIGNWTSAQPNQLLKRKTTLLTDVNNGNGRYYV